MKKESNGLPVIGYFLLGIAIGIIIQLLIASMSVPEVPDNRAMLTAVEIGTYENIDDSSEMFFNYRVDNFGDVEAKGVKVRCKILNQNGNAVVSVLDNFGSVASNSYDVGEVITDLVPYSEYEDGTYFCYVESCDDCEILSKNIPELREFYED